MVITGSPFVVNNTLIPEIIFEEGKHVMQKSISGLDKEIDSIQRQILGRENISDIFDDIEFSGRIFEPSIENESIRVLGEYFPKEKRISYYGVDDPLLQIIRIHERFHSVHHLTLDSNNKIWTDFPCVPAFYLELLAQLFTYKTVENDPVLLNIFLSLNKNQGDLYRTWRIFEHFDYNKCVELYWKIRNGLKSKKSLGWLSKLSGLVSDNLKLKIHRGSREIGGSCVEVSNGSTKILLDFGMPLVDEPISEKFLPDIPDLYDTNNPPPVDAIIISHPHLDHYGLINYVRNDIPVYIGEAALDLINISNQFTPANICLDRFRTFNKSRPFRIGCIEVKPYWMDHSAFDSYSFLIEAEGKKLFYSGDFRGHGRKCKVFSYFIKRPPQDIDYLIMEGTTLGRYEIDQVSEYEIERMFVNLFNYTDCTKLLFVSGQNIDRLVSVFKACRRTGHTLILDVYTAYVLETLSKYARLPYPASAFPEIRVLYPYYLKERMKKNGMVDILKRYSPYRITHKEIDAYPKKKVILCRPSMKKDIEWMKNIDNGIFIYSMWEGYLEKDRTRDFAEYLEKDRGFKREYIHSSGHADVKTLRQMVEALKPKYLIPIHTTEADSYEEIFKVKIKKS